MLSDDVFRERLEETLIEVEKLVARMRDCAAVDVAAAPHYWHLAVIPHFSAACPFELIVKSDQKFSVKLADEAFENLPVENFELFPGLVRAIEAGHVEKISKFDAKTDALAAIEMRVELGSSQHWSGERRVIPVSPDEEWRTHRYLAYRR